jgi:methylthioribose-1-phosphate isomerase
MRTIFWNYEKNTLQMIDQRRLPAALELFTCNNFEEVAFAIKCMVIRGAPALGVCGIFGLAMAAQQSNATQLKDLLVDLKKAKLVLEKSRPTAVNLGWGLNLVYEKMSEFEGSPKELRSYILKLAQEFADNDVITNKKISQIGAELINEGDTIIHHCNTGALAAVDWGTALGVIRWAHEQGKHVHVLVDETRPRLQGSRLTAWELEQYSIPYQIICDNMSGFFLRSGKVNKVIFGADRVAANGDVANKIGTYMLALAAKENGVPVYSVAPTSSVDCSLASGDLIPIEERPQDEVLEIESKGERVSPPGARALNPAFDVTPNHLITAFVTENGVIYPPFDRNLPITVNLTMGKFPSPRKMDLKKV